MGKFDEIRRIMKDFKGDVDGLANRKIEEIETAKARLNPTALKEELASLDAEYGKHFEFTRNMYREKLAAAVADRRRGNANKYIKGYNKTSVWVELEICVDYIQKIKQIEKELEALG